MQRDTSRNRRRIAILVDAENVSADNWPAIDRLFAGLDAEVTLTCFADFANAARAGWLAACKAHRGTAVSIQKTGRKNGADIALTIAAMELLNTHTAEMLVIVSSDSDFAPLARKIGEAGCAAIGIGSEMANEDLRQAFDRYIVLPPPMRDDAPAPPQMLTPEQVAELSGLVRRLAGEDPAGSVLLSRLGYVLRQENPGLADALAKGRLRKALHRYDLVEEHGEGTIIRVSPREARPGRTAA